MGYFDGTLDAFGYIAQSVNEISNPDESSSPGIYPRRRTG